LIACTGEGAANNQLLTAAGTVVVWRH
jgi:hypothetical protein